MDSSKVIHLVSNAPEHPENTSSSFKVSYNVPFDLTGKQIALVDATVTKAKANVDNEKITFTFTPKYEKRKGPMKSYNITAGANGTTSAEQYFSKLNKSETVMGDKLFETVAKFNKTKDTLEMEVYNYSDGDLYLKVNSHDDPTKGLKLLPGIQQTLSMPMHVEVSESNYLLSTGTIKIEQAPSGSKYRVATIKFVNVSKAFEKSANLPAFFSNSKIEVSVNSVIRVATHPDPVTVKPGTGYYDDIGSLLSRLNSNENFVKLAYLSVSYRKVVLFVRGHVKPCTIDLGGFEFLFGFDKRIINHSRAIGTYYTAQRPPDLTRGTHHFYIYCSLVKNIPVNNKMLQILATVDATKGTYGEQVVHPVRYPIFVDCVEGPQQMVEVTIADDTGTVQGLLMGRTKLTLAVKDS